MPLFMNTAPRIIAENSDREALSKVDIAQVQRNKTTVNVIAKIAMYKKSLVNGVV
nr:hypothetical protein [Viridibacillus arvi]